MLLMPARAQVGSNLLLIGDFEGTGGLVGYVTQVNWCVAKSVGRYCRCSYGFIQRESRKNVSAA